MAVTGNVYCKLIFRAILSFCLSLSHASCNIWNPSKCKAAYLGGGGPGVPMPCFIYKAPWVGLIPAFELEPYKAT